MAKTKNFYYRVNPNEVLGEAIFQENKEAWFMQFFKDLKNDDPEAAVIPLASDIIAEAHGFRTKRSIAGKASAQQRATYVEHMLNDVEHKSTSEQHCSTSSRSSNRSSTETKTEAEETDKPLSTDEPADPLPIGERTEDKIKVPYDLIMAAYNKFCPSLPRVVELTEKRRTAIRLRHLKYLKHATGPLEVLDTVFKKAEASDFLSGRDGKFKASFDWLMNESNMVKVIEGNYDNRSGTRIIPEGYASKGAMGALERAAIMRQKAMEDENYEAQPH